MSQGRPSMSDSMLRRIEAGQLNVAYFDHGLEGAPAAILLHGFPYDVHAYDEVTEALTAVGCRVIVPYLRGYGPTSFTDARTLRSGQQAILGQDLLSLMDALELRHAVLAGYDWGGRAACIVSALWPERAKGLVTCNGYNIQSIAHAGRPVAPADEHRYWYQYYFHSDRGAAGLAQNRYDLCKLLWQLWSPNWSFSDETYDRSAASFENPDFVEVVLHSYRHRYGLVAGDRDPAGRAAEDHGADDIDRRFGRRRHSRGGQLAARALLRGAVRLSDHPLGRPQRAAGSAGGVCRRRAVVDVAPSPPSRRAPARRPCLRSASPRG